MNEGYKAVLGFGEEDWLSPNGVTAAKEEEGEGVTMVVVVVDHGHDGDGMRENKEKPLNPYVVFVVVVVMRATKATIMEVTTKRVMCGFVL